jgi:hypothetical protein
VRLPFSGATVYNTDTFTLNSVAVTNENGTFSTYRPSSTAWCYCKRIDTLVESVQSWRIRDILNSDATTAYANIISSNTTSSTTQAGIVQLNDTISSTSSSTAELPGSVKFVADRAR